MMSIFVFFFLGLELKNYFFFFQAEDGIRDGHVTGVQTCALPICDGVDAVVASTVRRWSSAGLAERNPAVIARMEAMIRRTSDLGYCGCAAALARLNYGHRLGEIDRPTLLLCGSEDHGAPPENTRQMHAAIKGSRFVEIGEAGHISNIEQPEVFNQAVVSFLADVDRI